MNNNQIRNLLKGLVESLVKGQFEEIYQKDQNKRLSSAEIENAITAYPGVHTLPPDDAFDNYDTYGNEDEDENYIEFNLWFDNKESDLTISLTVFHINEYSIEDIHVL